MSNDDCLELISSLIIAIDQKISKQLSVIMHHQKFKELEANWRSFHQLVNIDYSKHRVKIKLLDISWYEISKDLNLSYDIKRSSLYYKIYSKELNTAGGLPFGLIVVAHHLSDDLNSFDLLDHYGDFDDVYTAELLGDLGKACFAQVIIGLDEYFFGDAPQVIIPNITKLARIIESDDFKSWQNLANHPNANFLNVVLPNYLIREPYVNYAHDFLFTEVGKREDCTLWGNSVFLLAMNVVREFTRISWFGFLRAYDENGEHGAIVELPNKAQLIPKISLAVENDSEWARLGLTVLSNIYLTDIYGFFSNSSVKRFHNETEKIVNMMQTNLMLCRFSHYIKVLLRDKVGNYDSPKECKEFLASWISKYVMNASFSDESVIARYPLKSYEITVTAQKDDPTIYDCEVIIEPQYQYDISTVSITLTTLVRNNPKNKEVANSSESQDPNASNNLEGRGNEFITQTTW